MENDIKRHRSIFARKFLLATVWVLSGILAAQAAPRKKSSPDPAAAERRANTSRAATVIDINRGSEKDLDSLPGVGPVIAKKIIKNRPYQSVDDLAKAGVGAKEIERIRPLVTVGKPASVAVSRPTPSTPKEAPAKAPLNPAPAVESADRAAPDLKALPSGSGMVWVNSETKVYHREGDRWYGKTKHGSYMSESDAIKAGYRAAKR